MLQAPTFTVGIEEEYLIVDAQSRDLVREPDPAFQERCTELTDDRSTGEFLQCQVEIATRPHAKVPDALIDLKHLRNAIAKAATEFGYAPIAASTHPFAKWREQTHTRKDRYDALSADLGQAVRRMLICGCHVHVGIEDPDLRIDLLNQAAYFMPHLLALSCSSPFWEGEDTGLASYRLTVFDALPRTGLPDQMNSWTEYQRLIQALVSADCIEDATKIWWDIRPSDKYPTLEQRVTDVCARADDAATIAAMFQALLAYLYRLRAQNQRWRIYPQILTMENRWRAQRYGETGNLVDHGKACQMPVGALMNELVDLLSPEAEGLGGLDLLSRARDVAKNGTSATRQRHAWRTALDEGASPREAGIAVVDQLIAEFTQ